MPHHTLYFAVFNSAHRVMKAEAVLKRAGVPIMLVPAPRALATDCGLAIRYTSDSNDLVLQTLSASETIPETIYNQLDPTHYEAIWTGDSPAATAE